MSDTPIWATWLLGGAAGGVLLWLLLVWWKGRPFATGDVFRASRLSRGNRLLPCQVLIAPTVVVHHTPRWIGTQEQSIHMGHISSVRMTTGILLSDILIETSGGASPIVCHGHHKGDAVKMKTLIERHQNAYYQSRPDAGPPGVPPASTVATTPPHR